MIMPSACQYMHNAIRGVCGFVRLDDMFAVDAEIDSAFVFSLGCVH